MMMRERLSPRDGSRRLRLNRRLVTIPWDSKRVNERDAVKELLQPEKERKKRAYDEGGTNSMGRKESI